MAELVDDALLEAIEKMEKAIEVAKEDFAGIRTGRANAGMFAKLMVDYYGAPTPLQQLASFNIPEARTVLIAPFDKTSMAAIEKAIRNSDLGVNPSNDGVAIRCNLPILTEERRKEYVKLARSKAEDSRVAIRNVRRKAKDILDKAIKDGGVGEDEGRSGQAELEQITKRHVELVDQLLATKEAELLEV
jgi:ribosome recycling factor